MPNTVSNLRGPAWGKWLKLIYMCVNGLSPSLCLSLFSVFSFFHLFSVSLSFSFSLSFPSIFLLFSLSSNRSQTLQKWSEPIRTLTAVQGKSRGTMQVVGTMWHRTVSGGEGAVIRAPDQLFKWLGNKWSYFSNGCIYSSFSPKNKILQDNVTQCNPTIITAFSVGEVVA